MSIPTTHRHCVAAAVVWRSATTALSIILLLAGASKLVAAIPSSDAVEASQRNLTIVVAVVELGIGGWLLSGYAVRACHLTATFVFAALAGAAAESALAMEASCGCFGDVAVRPVYGLCVDIAALFVLVAGPQRPLDAIARLASEQVYRPMITVSFLLFAAFFAGVGIKYTSALAPDMQRMPLAASKSALDLGDVWLQPTLTCVVPVRNQTNRTLRVAGFKTSCNCTTIRPQALFLRPHETADLELVIDLTRLPSYGTGSVAPFTVDVIPDLSDGMPSGRLRLHGRALLPFVTDPRALDFGDLVADYNGPVASVNIRPLIDLSSLTIDADTRYFANARIEHDSGSGQYRVFAQLQPGLPIGPTETILSLIARAADGSRLPPYHLTVRASIVSEIAVSPAVVAFGELPLGKASEQLVTLRSRRGRAFSIDAVDLPPGNLHIRILDDQLATSKQLRVRLLRHFPVLNLSSSQ